MQPFWYLNVSVWSGERESCLLAMCQNSVLAPYCKEWGPSPRYPPNTSKHLRIPWMPLRYLQTSQDIPQTPPRYPTETPDISKEHDMPTDDKRRQPTPPDILSVSGGAWWCLLACHVPWRGLGSIWGMSGGCLEVSECHSWNSLALECVWGVSWSSLLAVWSQNTILAHP